jgi:hypothetical protein
VLVLFNFLACLAKIEFVAEYALISNTDYAKLILTFGAHDVVWDYLLFFILVWLDFFENGFLEDFSFAYIFIHLRKISIFFFVLLFL